MAARRRGVRRKALRIFGADLLFEVFLLQWAFDADLLFKVLLRQSGLDFGFWVTGSGLAGCEPFSIGDIADFRCLDDGRSFLEPVSFMSVVASG
jgi:hypothetical protein